MLKCFRPAGRIVLGLALMGGVLQAQAFTPADRDASFNAHIRAFYEEKDGHAWFKESNEGGKVSYWMRAEQLEMVLDAYERTKNQELMVKFTKLFHGFPADHGKTWEDNELNDLLGYHGEAKLAAAYTMNELCRDGYFPPAGEKGDGGGFKGICARWIAHFAKDRNEQATFEPWLRKNAAAAWQARRLSDNLIWPRWPQPTPDGLRYSWGSRSAVVIMQVVRPEEAAKSENSP